MNNEIIEAISQIAREKKIDKDSLRDMLENIFTQMIIKKYGEANVDIWDSNKQEKLEHEF